MPSIWVESLQHEFEAALDLLAAAVNACPGNLWEAPMWEVPTDLFGPAPNGPDGVPVTDPEARRALVQRRSAPWSVAWHALECLDYDLAGEFAPWAPPPPFAGNPHWQLTSLPRAWAPAEILAYGEYCRERVRTTLATLTDDLAARPLPPAHRYAGQPHARVITGACLHTVEHAAQVGQFGQLARG